MLIKPPEMEFEGETTYTMNNIGSVVSLLSDYLWNYWNTDLIEKNILKRNLHIFLFRTFLEDVKNWAEDKITWDELLELILTLLQSDRVKCTFTFTLNHEGFFGLPENGITVIPSTGEYSYGAPMDPLTGTITGHGTLSDYRKDDDKISLLNKYKDININIHDNFVVLTTYTNNTKNKIESIINLMNNYIHILTLNMGVRFSFELISCVDQFGRIFRQPESLQLLKMIMYSLKQINENLTQSFEVLKIYEQDEVLQKSLQYYYHAKYLDDIRTNLKFPESERQKYLISDIINNLFKSVTIITGDPSTDRDHQRRYKKYGIDYDFWDVNIKKLIEIRNDWDVAHYYLTKDRLDKLNAEIGGLFSTTKDTISQYILFLRSED